MKLLAKAIIHEREDKDYAPEKTVKEVMAEMCPPKMKKKSYKFKNSRIQVNLNWKKLKEIPTKSYPT